MKDKTIFALTFDSEKDGWENSKGFVKREIPAPILDEKADFRDAVSVIVKVKYAGVCGSDRGIWNRVSFKDLIRDSLERENKTTRILGHEFVGEIVEAGSLVKYLYCDDDPKNLVKVDVGSLVSGDSHVTCGKCYYCRIGENNVCFNESILGISIDGVFAEYVKVPAKNLWAVDESRVRPEIAAIYDPFGNAVHAISKVDVRGQRVAVFGCGSIGLFSVLLLRSFGAAKIIAVDVNEENLELASRLGAHKTIKISPKNGGNNWEHDPEAVEKIMELTYGKGVDIAMEMAGPNSSVNNALESVRRGGQVILFGLKDGDFTIPKFSRVVVKGITLHSVIGRKIFGTWQTAQRVLSDKTNGVQEKIWDVILKKGEGTIIPFSEYDKDSFEKKMSEHPKIIFKF